MEKRAGGRTDFVPALSRLLSGRAAREKVCGKSSPEGKQKKREEQKIQKDRRTGGKTAENGTAEDPGAPGRRPAKHVCGRIFFAGKAFQICGGQKQKNSNCRQSRSLLSARHIHARNDRQKRQHGHRGRRGKPSRQRTQRRIEQKNAERFVQGQKEGSAWYPPLHRKGKQHPKPDTKRGKRQRGKGKACGCGQNGIHPGFFPHAAFLRTPETKCQRNGNEKDQACPFRSFPPSALHPAAAPFSPRFSFSSEQTDRKKNQKEQKQDAARRCRQIAPGLLPAEKAADLSGLHGERHADQQAVQCPEYVIHAAPLVFHTPSPSALFGQRAVRSAPAPAPDPR